MTIVELAKKHLPEYGDAVARHRVFRPGGPLDTSFYETHCKSCGLTTNKSLRWFLDRDYRCEEYGGTFETESLCKAVDWEILQRLIKTKTPEELREIFRELS